MNRIELVEEMITALQGGDLRLAANTLADTFEVTGLTPKSLSKRQFLAVQSELLGAMPDFSYNLSALRDDQEAVHAIIRISGTQTRDLDLPLFGLENIAATGLAVSLPQTRVAYQIENDKVVRMSVEAVVGGGLSGLLQQVGAELPLLPREGDVSESDIGSAG
ncbi:MAG: hypothetical protein H0U76_05640 [Ktedonobacteraceae bacterium]|nr:hypothetical protein [Ktedonobacteraceae bacterium]